MENPAKLGLDRQTHLGPEGEGGGPRAIKKVLEEEEHGTVPKLMVGNIDRKACTKTTEGKHKGQRGGNFSTNSMGVLIQ